MEEVTSGAHAPTDNAPATPTPKTNTNRKSGKKNKQPEHAAQAARLEANAPTSTTPPTQEGAAQPADATPEPTTQLALSRFVPDVVAGSEHKPGEQALIPTDLIDPSPIMLEVPLNEQKVNSYMGSMSNPLIGQLIEVQVMPKEGGRYQLIDGRHRIEAARRLHQQTKNERWTKIRATIRSDLSAIAATSAAQVMNTARRETTEYEDAVYFKALASAGVPIEQIASDAGYSPNTVRNRIALLSLPGEIIKKISAEWWFGSQHAKVAIPAVDKFGKPALHALESAIAQGDKMFAASVRMTAEEFRVAYVRELEARKLIREKDTTDERTARARYADLAARFDKLPTITLGEMKTARTYYADAEAFDSIMQSYRSKEAHAAKQREQQATNKSTTKPEREHAKGQSKAHAKPEQKGPSRKELIVERLEQKRREARIAAVLATKDLAPRELAFVAKDLTGYYEGTDEDNKALREALGMEKSDFETALLDLGKKDRDEIFLKLARAKDKTRIHRLMIACLVFRNPAAIEHENPLVKFDEHKALAEAEKEIEAESRNAKEAKK